MYKDITGIILSGGLSRRMGVNKSFLTLGNKYVIEIIADLMRDIFEKVILVTNEPELYKFLDLDTYEDIYKGKGPLGGIHAGLVNSRTEKNFIISCDIPLITKSAIEFIVNYPTEKLIKVPFADGYIQQLCGVYPKSCLVLIEEILRQSENITHMKKCRVLLLVEKAKGEIIDIERELPGYRPNLLLNMNDTSQYQKAADLFN